MTGRMMNDTLGKAHFWLTFIGTYCTFMPFHYLGWAANVRRYSGFTDDYMKPLIPLHQFITIAALFTGAAQLVFLYNLVHSLFRGPAAPANPWEGTRLEGIMLSPPPFPLQNLKRCLYRSALNWATSAIPVGTISFQLMGV